MLEALISSKTRLKILIKFFLNPGSSDYLRSLANEFGESTNAIRLELNRFEKAGMLESYVKGNRKVYRAQQMHPLFEEIRALVMKHTRIDQIVSGIAERLGDVEVVYLTGDLAKGLDVSILDLAIIGNPDKEYLLKLVDKAESLVGRKIRYIVYSREEAEEIKFNSKEYLLLWKSAD